MQNEIIWGNGMAKRLRTVEDALTRWPDYVSFMNAFIKGEFFADILKNHSGIAQEGTPLDDETLLSDTTAQRFKDVFVREAPPETPDEAFAALLSWLTVATIHITAPEGSDVTVTREDGVVVNTHTATGSPVDVDVGKAGTYNILAESGEDSASVSVEVDASVPSVDVEIKRLFPTGYTRLQYIQNTSTPVGAYIDTDLTISSDDFSVEATINAQKWGGWGSQSGSYCAFLGTMRADSNEYAVLDGYNSYNGAYSKTCNSQNILYSFPLNQDTLVVITAKEGVMTCRQNGSQLGQESYTFVAPNVNYALFFGGYNYAYCKMGIVKLWYEGTLVREFIPTKRKDDDAVGMYDIVNRKFYVSPNGTKFVAGPEAEVS